MQSLKCTRRHLVTVPPGAHLLSDALISSPILSADRSAGIPEELGGSGGGGGGDAAAGGGDFEFGVDPSIDPELAMVCGKLLPLNLNI